MTTRRHVRLAADCWRMIKALRAAGPADDDAAIERLIEMACDSAAESQRITDGHLPRGSTPRTFDAALTIIADARAEVADGAGHDCGEWVIHRVCQLCDRHECVGCGRMFVPKVGAAGQYCSRACYENPNRLNRAAT